MSSHLPRDKALEKEDRIDEMKKQNKKQNKKKKTTKNNNNNSPPIPQAQQAPALPYAKVVGCPGTGSYPAPYPDPTTQTEGLSGSLQLLPSGGWPLNLLCLGQPSFLTSFISNILITIKSSS